MLALLVAGGVLATVVVIVLALLVVVGVLATVVGSILALLAEGVVANDTDVTLALLAAEVEPPQYVAQK